MPKITIPRGYIPASAVMGTYGIARATLYLWASGGRIVTTKVRSRIFFNVKSLEQIFQGTIYLTDPEIAPDRQWNLNCTEAATLLNVHHSTLRGWIARGHVPIRRIAGRLWLRRADLASISSNQNLYARRAALPERTFNLKEASAYLNRPFGTVYKWVVDGFIPSSRSGTRYLLSESALQAFLSQARDSDPALPRSCRPGDTATAS